MDPSLGAFAYRRTPLLQDDNAGHLARDTKFKTIALGPCASRNGARAVVFSTLTNYGIGYNAFSKKVGPSEIQAQQSG